MFQAIMQMRFVTFVLCLSLVLLFSFVVWRRDTKTISERQFDLSKATVDVQSLHLQYKFAGVIVTVSGLEAKPKDWNATQERKYPPVVLFHDTRADTFSSKTWEEIGTIRLLTALGHRVFAIDLPGFGQTRIQGNLASGKFVESVIQHLGVKQCTLIVAGMAGSYVLPYVTQEMHTSKSGVVINGLLAIGTPPAEAIHVDLFRFLKDLPILYLQGANDDVSGEEVIKRYKEAPMNRVIVVEDAGYYVYFDAPVEFHKYVKLFILEFRRV